MLTLDDVLQELPDGSHRRRFFDAWLRWRGDRMVPLRSDVRPEDLAAALSSLGVLEVEAMDKIIMRVSSSIARDRTGRDSRGGNLIEMTRPEDRAMRMKRLWQMVTTPCGALAETRMTLKSGLESVLHSLVLPVAAEPDAPPRLLYVVSEFTGTHEPGPDDRAGGMPLSHHYRLIDIGAGVPDS